MRPCRHRRIVVLCAVVLVTLLPGTAEAQKYVGVVSEPYVDEPIAGALTTDRGLVIVYFDERPFEWKTVIVKFDDAGFVSWARQVPLSEGAVVRAVAAATDGGVFLAGRVSTARQGWDAWVARLDSGGDVLWQSSFGRKRADDAAALRATDDGGAVVVGSTEVNGSGDERMLIAKLAGDGAVTWSRTLSARDSGRATGVRPIENGYYVVGTRDGSGLAVRLDDEARVLWARATGTELRALALASDGNGLAAVSAPNRVVRVSADGERLWETSYERPDDLRTIGERSTGFLLGGDSPFMWVADVSHQGEPAWGISWTFPGPPFAGPARLVAEGPDGHVYIAAQPWPALLIARLGVLGDPPECFSGWGPVGLEFAHEQEPLDHVAVSTHPVHVRRSNAAPAIEPLAAPEWACRDSVIW